jgi:hypothetical protein
VARFFLRQQLLLGDKHCCQEKGANGGFGVHTRILAEHLIQPKKSGSLEFGLNFFSHLQPYGACPQLTPWQERCQVTGCG